jgi:hypothetical protein
VARIVAVARREIMLKQGCVGKPVLFRRLVVIARPGRDRTPNEAIYDATTTV